MQKAKLRSLLLKAKKLALYTMASNELIADGMKFEQLLGEMMVKAIAWELDYAFLNGNGVGQPTGVLSDPALISVAKESGQAADTISWNNLKAMFNRLHPASVNNAVWVANANTRVQLLSLVQYVENQAGTENVGGTWIPAMRDDGKGGFTILGIPVIFTEKLPTLGDAGDILLADFSKYIVGLRREMSLAKSGHVGFQTDETGYRGILRADGQGAWSKPVTPKTGETLSWCVTLAERA